MNTNYFFFINSVNAWFSTCNSCFTYNSFICSSNCYKVYFHVRFVFYYSSYFREYSLRYFFYYINYFSFFSVCKLLRTFASCICYFFSTKHCNCYISFANKSLNHVSFNKTTSSNNFSYFRIGFSLLIGIQYNLSSIVLSSISIFLLLFFFVLFHYSRFSIFLRDAVSNFKKWCSVWMQESRDLKDVPTLQMFK